MTEMVTPNLGKSFTILSSGLLIFETDDVTAMAGTGYS